MAMGSPCDEQKFLKDNTKLKVQIVRVARLKRKQKSCNKFGNSSVGVEALKGPAHEYE